MLLKIAFAALTFLMLACVIVIAVSCYFNIDLPANLAYNRALGSKVTMLYDAGSIYDFYNRTEELRLAIETEFTGHNTSKLYANWLPWDQIPENTVTENLRWVSGFELRCWKYYDEQLAIENGSKSIMYPFSTWEQQTIQGLRNESKRAGGVVWAAEGAWYQVHASGYYMLHHQFWYFGLWDVICLICYVLMVVFVICAIGI